MRELSRGRGAARTRQRCDIKIWDETRGEMRRRRRDDEGDEETIREGNSYREEEVEDEEAA